MKMNTMLPVRLIIIPCLLLVSLISCGDGNKENKDAEMSETESDITSVESEDEDSNEWKGWEVPGELDDYSLETFISDPYKNNDLYSAMAVYKNGDRFLRIQVVDGSNDKGKSEIRQHLEIAEKDINSESSFGYEKTVEHNGIKAREEFLASPGQFLIRYVLKDHYGVSVKSNAADAETVWQLVDLANLEGLQ